MKVFLATDQYWPQIEPFVEPFVRQAKYSYVDTGWEDLPDLLRSHLAVLGVLDDNICSLLAFQIEKRPATLPVDASDRIYLRFAALAASRSPLADVAALMGVARKQLAARQRPAQLQVYGRDRWLINPLLAVGFDIVERIEFLQLANLQRRRLPTAPKPRQITLRNANPDDLPRLAALDARSFPSRWHFGKEALFSLLLSGRMNIAFIDEQPVGYWAIGLSAERDAHLSRLAVDPDWQGRGVGRYLLANVLAYCQQEQFRTVLLNTQSDNQTAQSLYRSAGFRPTGRIIPMLTYSIH